MRTGAPDDREDLAEAGRMGQHRSVMANRFGATCLGAAALLAAGAFGCAEGSSGAGETAARIGRELNPFSSFETRVTTSGSRRFGTT